MKKFLKGMPLYWWAMVIMIAMLITLLWVEMSQIALPAWMTTIIQFIGGIAGIIACITIWPHCPEWYHKGATEGAIFIFAYTFLVCAITRTMGVESRDLPSIVTLPSSVAMLSFLVSMIVMCIKGGK